MVKKARKDYGCLRKELLKKNYLKAVNPNSSYDQNFADVSLTVIPKPLTSKSESEKKPSSDSALSPADRTYANKVEILRIKAGMRRKQRTSNKNNKRRKSRFWKRAPEGYAKIDYDVPDRIRGYISCKACGSSFPFYKLFERHIKGSNHLKNVMKKKRDPAGRGFHKSDYVVPNRSIGYLYCTPCDFSVQANCWEGHLQGEFHLKNVKKMEVRPGGMEEDPVAKSKVGIFHYGSPETSIAGGLNCKQKSKRVYWFSQKELRSAACTKKGEKIEKKKKLEEQKQIWRIEKKQEGIWRKLEKKVLAALERIKRELEKKLPEQSTDIERKEYGYCKVLVEQIQLLQMKENNPDVDTYTDTYPSSQEENGDVSYTEPCTSNQENIFVGMKNDDIENVPPNDYAQNKNGVESYTEPCTSNQENIFVGMKNEDIENVPPNNYAQEKNKCNSAGFFGNHPRI